jgi:hypothetical protein
MARFGPERCRYAHQANFFAQRFVERVFTLSVAVLHRSFCMIQSDFRAVETQLLADADRPAPSSDAVIAINAITPFVFPSRI